MKYSSVLSIPLAFVSGVAFIVALNQFGLVRFSSGDAEQNPITQTSKQLAQSSRSQSRPSSAVPIQTVEDVAALQTSIQSATRERDLIRSQLNELSKVQVQVKNMQKQLEALNKAEGIAEPLANNSESSPSQILRNQNQNQNERSFERRGDGFGDGTEDIYQSLIAAGVDPSVASNIKQADDQWTLKRLDLIDQASRNGTRGSDQFREEIRKLREERPDMRSQLGDDEYDRYLFASGQSNRVRISNIIDGSAAQIAGMQVDDIVLSYAGNRVFGMRELQRATREGVKGEPIVVTVDRQGEAYSLSIVRGPLGVSLSGESRNPGS